MVTDTTSPGRDGKHDGSREGSRDGRRDSHGRFTAGTKAGPGRPATKKATSPATDDLSYDADALLLRGHELERLDKAWRHIIVTFPPRQVERLAEEVLARNGEVPDVVMEFLDREGLCLKGAKHRK